MEHIVENPFLGKDQNYLDYFAEFDKNIKKKQASMMEQAEVDDEESVHLRQLKTIENFVQEKDVLIESVKEYSSFMRSARIAQQKLSIADSDHLKALSFRIMRIIERYQEQSALLDTIMEQLIAPCMAELKQICQIGKLAEHEKGMFQFVYTLCKVRGHKNVTKWLPHEVEDVEPCFEMLCKLNPNDANEWYLSYVLQVWMSILIIVPFDIDSIDTKSHLIDRIVAYIMQCLETHGKCREGGALLLSRFITRPDIVKKGYLGKILQQLGAEYIKYSKLENKAYYLIGLLDAASSILKHGQRKELLIEIKQLMSFFDMLKADETKINNVLIRKTKVQYCQRVGITLLPAKVASWRYKIPSNTTAKIENTQEIEQSHESLPEEVDISNVEEVITYLLQQLADKDTIVRWSASKGIGRITGRLTMEMGDEIISNIMNLMVDSETEHTWHGCCLSIAELCRRGLLLPNRLDQLMPLLEKALLYDINKGNFSVGQNVRDAACYVSWTFARAYSVEVMKKYVGELSKNLMLVALTDKETNCRRAASAAFQEHVGRQGSFPHGIEILTEADYFTLSSIMNSYLRVTPFVCQYVEYFEPILWHLVNVKLSYHAVNVRSLASKCIGLITTLNPGIVVQKVLPNLCKQCEDKVLNNRHGAVLGVAEILLSLCGKSGREKEQIKKEIIATYSIKNRKLLSETKERKAFDEMYSQIQVKDFTNLISEDHTKSLLAIIPILEEKKLFRGLGGEIMRNAISILIESMCEAKIPMTPDYLKMLHAHLEETLKHPIIETQKYGAKALEAIYTLSNIRTHPQFNLMVESIVKNAISNPMIEVSRGYTIALGSFPAPLTIQYSILQSILKNTAIKKTQNDEPETRRESLFALQKQCNRIGYSNLTTEQIQSIEKTIFKAFNDYTIDRRGDIGSVVREAAMIVGFDFFLNPLCKEESILKYVCLLLKQSAEKIDSVRYTGGNTLMNFLRKTKSKLPSLEVLLSVTEPIETDAKTEEPVLNWREPNIVFSSLSRLLGVKPYNESILEGWVLSSGGITESTVKASTTNLLQYISQSKDVSILYILVGMLLKHAKIERIVLPVITTLEQIFNANYFNGPENMKYFEQILAFIEGSTKQCKSVNRLCKTAGLLANLYAQKELRKRTGIILLDMLFNKEFPKLRKETAEKLYMVVLTEDNPTLNALLSETNWTDDIEVIIGIKEVIETCLLSA